jgi:hypothetical protein
MKGIPTFGLKRLKRVAAVAGIGALVVGGAVLGSAQAQAATQFGTAPGALTLTPASGAGTVQPTYNSTACPAADSGAAHVFFIDPTTPAGTAFNNVNKDELTNLAPSVAAPFSGAFTFPIGNVPSDLSITTFPTTVELAVWCTAAANGTGAGVWDQSTFVTFAANGSYTTSATPPAGPVTPTVTLTATSPAYAGQNITLTANVAASANGTPAGTVQFAVGGTNLGAAQTLTNGVASFTTNTFPVGTAALTAVYTSSDATKWLTATGSLSLNVQTAPTFTGMIPLAVTVPSNGAFSLTVDSTDVVTLATTTAQPLVATGTTTPIVVADSRNTYPGWSVSGQDSAWTGAGTAAGSTISGNQLGWVPGQPTGAAALPQGVTLGATVAPGAPGLGSTAAVLASVHAATGNGYGTATLNAALTLNIPATALAGPYTSGLTISAVNTNP